MRAVIGLACLLATCMLSACGQMGPLYLPGEEQPSRQEAEERLPDVQPDLLP
ncbi:MAG: lipoprotein [Pseudomonadota bacterium]